MLNSRHCRRVIHSLSTLTSRRQAGTVSAKIDSTLQDNAAHELRVPESRKIQLNASMQDGPALQDFCNSDPNKLAVRSPIDHPTQTALKSFNEEVSEAETPVAVVKITPPRPRYWNKIKGWENVSEQDFMDYQWQTSNSVQTKKKLFQFLEDNLDEIVDEEEPDNSTDLRHIKTRDDFIKDVKEGIALAPMSVRITPHILSIINWKRPLQDPIRRQFLPMKSSMIEDHPELSLDSLHETEDSIARGLIHRYPDKALFLATSVCPLYCRFCTRSYSVGGDTPLVDKKSYAPGRKRWDAALEKILETPALHDIVISGGDSYYLEPEHMISLGKRILDIDHIRRIRFASKGLAVCPSRFLDQNDGWFQALVEVSQYGRDKGKSVALHTHFNHPKEITWVTEEAANRLFSEGVTVRNQSVLLKGVNDDLPTMSLLIKTLADNNIIPYYVYQGDMVRGVEDLRTPLQTILDLESNIRGTIAGFLVPSFVVDLPGGGGKRLAASHDTYDRITGISRFTAPGVKGGDRVYEYHDPLWSLPSPTIVQTQH